MPGSLIVVNPYASKTRDASTLAALTERARDVLTERDGAEPRLAETAAAADVAPLVREARAAGVASVIGVGGDGTLRQIAGVLADSDVPLGIIPAGTGNQVAAALGVPRSPFEAADALATATPREIDLGEVTIRTGDVSETSVCLIGCGGGFDAELMATTPAGLKRWLGSLAYFVQAARLMPGLSATPCRVTVDEHTFETGVTVVLIGNMGHLVPGRLDLKLPLDPYDGLLELIIVGASGPVSGLRGLRDQLRRTQLGGGAGDASIRLRGRSIEIEPVAPLPLQIDGDPVGRGSLKAHVRPKALRVLTP